MSRSAPEQKPAVTKRLILLGAIITLGNLADIIHKSSRLYLFQQAQCLLYYKRFDPSTIQQDFRIDEALCKVTLIQSHLATINGIDSFLNYLPPLLVLAPYNALLPRMGLRRLVLLNIVCSGLEVLYTLVALWFHRDWGTLAALLSFVFNLIGGGALVRLTIIVTYIADISPPNQLTKTYNYMSGFYYLANVAGSLIGSLLLTHHVHLLNGFSIACYALTACVSLNLPSYCGRDKQDDENSRLVIPDEDDDHYDSLRSSSDGTTVLSRDIRVESSLFRILLKSWLVSYRSFLSLFSTSFPTSTVLLIYLLNSFAIRIEVLLPQYTSLLLSWPLATVNAGMALKNLISTIFLFTLPTYRQIYLKPRMCGPQIDLLVTQMSLVANTLGMIMLGVSAPAWFFVLALCVYTSGMGLADSLSSYGTFTVPAGESVAEFYVHMGLINTIASLVAGPLWSALFTAILGSGKLPLGLPFWLCAGLFAVGIAGVTVLKQIPQRNAREVSS